jgi:hypothetical protein
MSKSRCSASLPLPPRLRRRDSVCRATAVNPPLASRSLSIVSVCSSGGGTVSTPVRLNRAAESDRISPTSSWSTRSSGQDSGPPKPSACSGRISTSIAACCTSAGRAICDSTRHRRQRPRGAQSACSHRPSPSSTRFIRCVSSLNPRLRQHRRTAGRTEPVPTSLACATWIVDFLDNSVGVSSKANALYVRAVRGGP